MAVTDAAARHLPIAEPGVSVFTAKLEELLQWGVTNSLWVFPMATSCCGIELMAAAASRVDLDRMGTIVRATPRQADVMVVAGTITVKMAPRVRTLWDQMPEPKWCIAMGSCAISGDFYRNLYPVVPGIDRVIPVDVYVPGCPPSPEALMHGLLRLQEKIRSGGPKAELRDPKLALEQLAASLDVTKHERGDEDDVAIPPSPVAKPWDGETKDDLGIVDAASHVAVATRLRDAGFTQLVYVVATDFPAKPGPERIEVAYALRSPGRGSRVATWRLSLEPPGEAPSLVGVLAGADWQEREQFDLLGVRFSGHPDLRRLLLPDDWDGHPLRRDYPEDKAHPPWR